jgi:hypothetical protein
MTRLADRLGGEVAAASWPPLTDLLQFEAVPSTMDELARLMIASRAAHFVIGVRWPDQRLRNALSLRDARFVLALDDPRNAVADILTATGGGEQMAVRAVANSCPLVMPFENLPGALTLRSEQVRADPGSAVSAIAAHFGIAIEPLAAAAIVQELAPLAAWASPPSETLAENPPGNARKMLDGALLAYRRRFAGEQLDQIVWTRELFMLASDSSKSPIGPIDVGGGSRVLIYGPYIHLPPGSWSAQVVLGFSREAAEATFLVDAYADRQLASTMFRPGGSSIYSAELTFSLDQPAKGLEIRVMVTSDNAAGRLAFGRVVLQPLGMRHPDSAEAEADFERVLDL